MHNLNPINIATIALEHVRTLATEFQQNQIVLQPIPNEEEVEFGRHIATIIIGHTRSPEFEIEEDEILDFISSDSDSEQDFTDFDLHGKELGMEIRIEDEKEESLSEPECEENCEPMVIIFVSSMCPKPQSCGSPRILFLILQPLHLNSWKPLHYIIGLQKKAIER